MPTLRWQMNEDFIKLLASLEVSTPLREPSDLADLAFTGKLLEVPEGLIGELAELPPHRAVVSAVRTGRERINTSLLEALG